MTPSAKAGVASNAGSDKNIEKLLAPDLMLTLKSLKFVDEMNGFDAFMITKL